MCGFIRNGLPIENVKFPWNWLLYWPFYAQFVRSTYIFLLIFPWNRKMRNKMWHIGVPHAILLIDVLYGFGIYSSKFDDCTLDFLTINHNQQFNTEKWNTHQRAKVSQRERERDLEIKRGRKRCNWHKGHYRVRPDLGSGQKSYCRIDLCAKYYMPRLNGHSIAQIINVNVNMNSEHWLLIEFLRANFLFSAAHLIKFYEA